MSEENETNELKKSMEMAKESVLDQVVQMAAHDVIGLVKPPDIQWVHPMADVNTLIPPKDVLPNGGLVSLCHVLCFAREYDSDVKTVLQKYSEGMRNGMYLMIVDTFTEDRSEVLSGDPWQLYAKRVHSNAFWDMIARLSDGDVDRMGFTDIDDIIDSAIDYADIEVLCIDSDHFNAQHYATMELVDNRRHFYEGEFPGFNQTMLDARDTGFEIVFAEPFDNVMDAVILLRK